VKYLQSTPFSVALGGSQAFRDGWDRTFGKQENESVEPTPEDESEPELPLEDEAA
jgi:hypothetical protein